MTADAELALQPDADRHTLPGLIEDVAERHGERIAVRFEGVDLSYAGLLDEVRAVARGLVASGVGKGTRVAVLMGNRPEWIIATFAIGYVGGVVVPVNTLATADEREYILRHGDARVLLMQPGLAGKDYVGDLRDAHGEALAKRSGQIQDPALPQLRHVFCLGEPGGDDAIRSWSELKAAGSDVPDAILDGLRDDVRPGDDAFIIYTSGTTSKPKGVLHMQRAPAIMAWRWAEYMALVPEDIVYTAQPFFWTAGITMSLGSALAAGAKLVLAEVFKPEIALELIERERASVCHAWPHQEKAMAEHPSAAGRDLSCIEKVEFASPLAALAGIEKDVWGTYGSYGMSETFTIASALPASAPADLRSATSGIPLPGMQIEIVDVETGEPLPQGERGEIAVRGLTLMRGYYKVDPEQVFDSRGFFRTQDGGWFDDDGYLHWTGRLSNIIKTGGANVSPVEIEKALEERTDLKIAQPVGVEHPTLGEAIVLCIVPVAGEHVDHAELAEYLKPRLAPYKRPRHILTFDGSDLEYTSNQKVQVAPLKAAAEKRLAEDHVEIAGHVY